MQLFLQFKGIIDWTLILYHIYMNVVVFTIDNMEQRALFLFVIKWSSHPYIYILNDFLIVIHALLLQSGN